MLHISAYELTDADEVKRVIRANPWATFISNTQHGLVASHYPVLLDESTDDIVIVSHFGRPDDVQHELGDHEMLVIVQGPHSYISSSLYTDGEIIPTWDHITVHLWGTPEVLTAEENYTMLGKLTDHFESEFEHGHSLTEDVTGTRKTARGTIGLRMHVDRFQGKAKVSQTKGSDQRERIIEHVAEHNPQLAEEMRRHS